MSVLRIISLIILVVYGTNASHLLGIGANKLSVGSNRDIVEDYYVDDPLGEAIDQNEDSEYTEDDWDHTNEIIGRQLPEDGREIKIAQDKKSQTWCKVKKTVRQHYEPGYEFFPKTYSEYDCVPHIDLGTSQNSIFSSDICSVNDVRCKPLQKTFTFFKWPVGAKNLCALMKMEKTVNVGCNCVSHAKFHFL